VRHDPTFWLLARAFGLTAYLLVTLSILVGLLLKARPFRSLKPAAVTDLHRILAMLGLAAVAGHGIALVLDSTVRVSVPALFVPGLIPYRPVWTSVGVVAAETMVLVYASFSQRKRIGTRNWRRLHWATYGIFAAATIHGLAAGSDSSQPWAFGVYLLAVGSVAAATSWRFLVPPARGRSRRPEAKRRERDSDSSGTMFPADRQPRHTLSR
jgi:methionine sulfoxide reductase heme-binding subunit